MQINKKTFQIIFLPETPPIIEYKRSYLDSYFLEMYKRQKVQKVKLTQKIDIRNVI